MCKNIAKASNKAIIDLICISWDLYDELYNAGVDEKITSWYKNQILKIEKRTKKDYFSIK